MKKLIALILALYVSQISLIAQSEDKRVELSVGFAVDKVKTEEFEDFDSFAGIPASQIPSNFQATQSELEEGFKSAFRTSRYLRGLNLNGSFYLNKSFALVADFSVTTNNKRRQIADNLIFFEDISQAKRTQYAFLGGVQWKYRKHRIQPFARVLGGALHSRNRVTLSISNQNNPSASEESFQLENNYTAFALSGGGGFDVRVNKRFAFRVIQFDYITSFSGSRTASLTAPGGGASGQVDLGLTTFGSSTKNSFRFVTGIVF